MNWNERLQKVDKSFSHPFTYHTQKLLADQKRVEGKKAAGSDDSEDDHPKKKSGKVNGKSKKR